MFFSFGSIKYCRPEVEELKKSQNAKGTDTPKELPLTPAIGALVIYNSVPKQLFVAICSLFRHISFFSLDIKKDGAIILKLMSAERAIKKCFCVFIQVEKIIVHLERPEISFFLSIVNLRSDNGLDKLRHPSR